LKTTLPPEVHILTLEPLSQEKNSLTILFRIEHIYDQNEHSKLSKPVTIEIDVNTSKNSFFFTRNFFIIETI
jgi:hypothetical protein